MERRVVRLHGLDFALSRTIRSIDMGLHGVSLGAAYDTGDAPHRPNVTSVPREIVWRPSDRTHSRPIHGKDFALSRTIRSIDMGLHGVSLDAADDTGDAPHRPDVYVTDVPRDDSVAPEGWYA